MKSAAIAYVLCAVVTFGHAANTLHPPKCGDNCNDRKLLGASGVSIVWPLYWSTKLWSIGIKEKAND